MLLLQSGKFRDQRRGDRRNEGNYADGKMTSRSKRAEMYIEVRTRASVRHDERLKQPMSALNYTRPIHHTIWIGRDVQAGRGVTRTDGRAEGKKARQEGHGKRSRARFLVVEQRRGGCKNVSQKESGKENVISAGAVPGGKPDLTLAPPALFSTRNRHREYYCACVSCSRDNLSPLKEFRDISQQSRSVVGGKNRTRRMNRSDRRSAPSPRPETPLRSTHWADWQKSR